MNAWQAMLLGLVQGLCEFLPVSSSGHLVLFQTILGIDDPGILLDTLLHVGTLIAIFVVFWRDIWAMIRRPLSKPVYMLVIATIPAVVATLLLGDFFEIAFTGKFLGLGFLATSVILMLTGRKQGHRREMNYDGRAGDGPFSGLCDSARRFPLRQHNLRAVWRAAWIGRKSAEFSFLMSIPAILGSVVLQVKDLATGQAAALPVVPVILGTVVAALSSLFAIKFMLYIVKRTNLRWFALYTAILGVLVCLDQWVFRIFF